MIGPCSTDERIGVQAAVSMSFYDYTADLVIVGLSADFLTDLLLMFKK